MCQCWYKTLKTGNNYAIFVSIQFSFRTALPIDNTLFVCLFHHSTFSQYDVFVNSLCLQMMTNCPCRQIYLWYKNWFNFSEISTIQFSDIDSYCLLCCCFVALCFSFVVVFLLCCFCCFVCCFVVMSYFCLVVALLRCVVFVALLCCVVLFLLLCCGVLFFVVFCVVMFCCVVFALCCGVFCCAVLFLFICCVVL